MISVRQKANKERNRIKSDADTEFCAARLQVNILDYVLFWVGYVDY